ncbi:MAG: 4-oxalocrotonate tautomerase [Proteobacteria bacterium]|nr:4-oxalocrotonate tautomerase [Pseudomonadota bacterium]
MPILNLKLSAARSDALSEGAIRILADKTHAILGKKPEVTAITIAYIDPRDWIVDGKSLAATGQSSLYLDIKITDETNTKQEKARYIAEVFEDFAKLLGNLHPHSYIYVEDVRAAAYGFGGKTQEYRYHHG